MEYNGFSILMSVYAKDNPAWVAQALDSVLANTRVPAEVVVVIDGPIPDELKAILDMYAQKYPSVKLCPLAKNGGLGAALAYGLTQCSHELVARMDADDIALPDRFEKQLSYFEKHPETDVLGGYIQEVEGETLTPVAVRQVPQTDAQIKQFLKTRTPFNHVTVMFKKGVVLAVGNYQSFYFMEDYYLWARLAAKNAVFANLSEVLLNVRVNAAMYGRRGGWKYFKSNLAISRALRELGLISLPTHLFNTAVRFGVQVLMPNTVRAFFYKKVLR